MFGKYVLSMSTFNETFTENKEKACPTKKFSFARRAKKDKAPKSPKAEPKEEAKTNEIDQSLLTGNHLQIKDISGDQNVIKTASDYEGKENVIIENVSDSQIVLPFSIKCLYIKNVKNTNVYVGSVSSASFVNEATDCKIHVQSHQIRIHHSHRVKFYLTARSSPIIEHCSENQFG